MAHSRLERIGTIYTRITNLIRTGAMKLDERPLWYEVYQSFPPATPPRYDNPAPAGEIRKIFYPEDLIRAKYYSAMRTTPAANLVEDGRPSHCQVFLENCKRSATARGASIDDVFDETLASTRQTFSSPQTEPTENSTITESEKTRQKSSINMKNIFSENAEVINPEPSQPKSA
ncbi:Mitochondrial ribosomal protein S23 [Nesidiocoris tenuis]|uniref:Small ribosomal subunit protein mS23 n=1 Tax=Nesidiocoris tenuis TaxID=355587 RepID=A0ABN7B756_9HEMI|nr:Mitochondrial ribosomal protein S23 [Nesidiocoris tenuis]